MTAVKLSQSMRDNIRTDIMTHRFSKEQQALEARKEGLFVLVYHSLYTPEQRDQLASLPEGIAGYATTFYTVLQTDPSEGNEEGGYKHHRITTSKYSVRVWASPPRQATFDAKHPVTVEFKAWRAAKEALDDARSNAASEINNILGACTTVGKLRDVWPEIIPFIDKRCPPPPPKLPVRVPGQLNNELELPPDQAKKAAA